MRSPKQPFVIVSAEKANLSDKLNGIRNAQLRERLETAGFNPVRLYGVYKGISERSFMVPIGIPVNPDIQQIKTIAFTVFDQESVLTRYSDGSAWLEFPDSSKDQQFGQFKEVTEQTAKQSGDYTYRPDTGKYYMLTLEICRHSI